MSAECLTLPQYVVRSYRDAGRSLLPGKDADIFAVVQRPANPQDDDHATSQLPRSDVCSGVLKKDLGRARYALSARAR